MSVDVEEWFQVGAFENVIDRREWSQISSRVEANCDRVLAMFAAANVRASFFILGWVAARYPAMVRRIAEAGHEIASHGWDHKRVFTMTPAGFAADLVRARATIEDAGGAAVTGYRAPSFSIDARTPWAHPILAEQGYDYSSSVAPVRHDHYGWPEAPRYAWRPVPGMRMVELPVTTARAMGRTLAAGGGGFFRMLPYGFSRWAICQNNRAMGQPAIFYFHPWEIDPGQPRVRHAPMRSRVRHYSRLRAMSGKLERLLRDFSWDRVDHVVARQAIAEHHDAAATQIAMAQIEMVSVEKVPVAMATVTPSPHGRTAPRATIASGF